MTVAVGIAGVTGWTGRAVAEAVLAADDLTLKCGVSRSAAGQDLGRAWDNEANGLQVVATVEEALEGVDVLVDYTSHTAVLGHTLTAINHGVSVVIGTSGLTASDFTEIDAAARDKGVGVIAAGNFSLSAALVQAAALLAARHMPSWEIVDYASAGKPDAPSGTARELADLLGRLRQPEVEVPVAETAGQPQTRGGTVSGVQVHAIRLPGFVLATEVVFGLPDERLTIRHDAGSSAMPYVAGTLLAVRAVQQRVGLTRGLSELLLAS